MKIEKSETETYLITELDKLDPITVYVTNYSPGKGKIVIECYGKTWTTYWGGMGSESLQVFFQTCSNDYILNRLLTDCYETDFEEISKRSNHQIIAENDFELAMMATEMAEFFGDSWYMDIPQCLTSEYHYANRIVDVIKEAFKVD